MTRPAGKGPSRAGAAWTVGVGLLLLGVGAAGAAAGARWDTDLLRLAGAVRTPWLDDLAREITVVGNGGSLVTVGLVAWALRAATGRPGAWRLALVPPAALLLSDLVKQVIDRARPDAAGWLVEVSSPSFPSGHAFTATLVYGVLAWSVAAAAGPTLRRWTVGVTALGVGLIGISRVYLAVHYPTDVLGGWGLGLTLLGLGALGEGRLAGRDDGLPADA